MTKPSFINKKFLTILVCLIFIGAIGFGVYTFLKPKADLSVPYKTIYDFSVNEQNNFLKSNHTTLESYLLRCSSMSDDTLADNHIDRAEIDINIGIYDKIDFIYINYDRIRDFLILNIPYVKDLDGKLSNYIKNLTSSYELLLEDIHDCLTHMETYLTTQNVQSKPLPQLYREIKNFNTFYFAYLQELSNFYMYASQIAEKYLIDSFKITPVTKYGLKTASLWAKEIVSLLTNYSEQVCNLQNLKISCEDLTQITNLYLVNTPDYYSNKDNYDNTINCFTNLDFNTCISYLAKNDYSNYISKLETDEEKANAIALGTTFFLVAV